MTDPDRMPEEPSRNHVSLWILVGLMVLIAVGGLVYGLGSQGDLVCVKAADGTPVWHKSMRKDLEGEINAIAGGP